MGKRVLMVISMMKGGGAERVASVLMNEFHNAGHEIEFVLTSSTADEVIRTDLRDGIPLTLLREQTVKPSQIKRLQMKCMRVYSTVFCRIFEAMKFPVPAHFSYCSFVCQYWQEIKLLRELMKKDPERVVISFLQPSIPMVLLAARGLPNKVIISERDNPKRLMKKRYGRPFVEKYYTRVDHVVYQTQDAKDTYPECIRRKGKIIPNPLKDNLPEAYEGIRNKNITTFCRISEQKNLPLLIDAFALVHKEHPDYMLRIIGDAHNEEGKRVKQKAKQQIQSLGISDAVQWEPFRANVHQDVLADAMYVNSSDFEGMSNAMLEAMAIGMPVICTDCPIGGAKAMIENHINGLLVPVGETQDMYQAMKTIIENQELANAMSRRAARLKSELSLTKIAKEWMELL